MKAADHIRQAGEHLAQTVHQDTSPLLEAVREHHAALEAMIEAQPAKKPAPAPKAKK